MLTTIGIGIGIGWQTPEGGGVIPGDWILLTGFWDDGGDWDNSAVWID